MPKSRRYIIVYDISDDRERARVSKILCGYGDRVQESVFECRLSVSMRERLRKQLEALELKTGFILVYRVYDKSKRIAIGNIPDDMVEVEEHAFVV